VSVGGCGRDGLAGRVVAAGLAAAAGSGGWPGGWAACGSGCLCCPCLAWSHLDIGSEW
jgi:hypothetical protein